MNAAQNGTNFKLNHRLALTLDQRPALANTSLVAAQYTSNENITCCLFVFHMLHTHRVEAKLLYLEEEEDEEEEVEEGGEEGGGGRGGGRGGEGEGGGGGGEGGGEEGEEGEEEEENGLPIKVRQCLQVYKISHFKRIKF